MNNNDNMGSKALEWDALDRSLST